ncbi:autotransporter family protein [Bordetella genomosp. 1]|nr:autotransporter outer membrane beta-barrel domain-containing protein [Bordetella genomosp. 1]
MSLRRTTLCLSLAAAYGLAAPMQTHAAGAGGNGDPLFQGVGGANASPGAGFGDGGNAGQAGTGWFATGGNGGNGSAGVSGTHTNGDGGAGLLYRLGPYTTIGSGTIESGGGGGGGGSIVLTGGAKGTAIGGNGAVSLVLTGAGGEGRTSINAATLIGGGGGGGGSVVQDEIMTAGRPDTWRARGGDGAAAVQWLNGQASFLNTGALWGGAGGGGGAVGERYDVNWGFVGDGGNGGSGLVMSGTQQRFINQGAVYGGNAGAGFSSGVAGRAVQLDGSQSEIVQAGRMEAGRDAYGNYQDAVVIAGNDNTLTLVENSVTIGNVCYTGTNNWLRIGGGSTAAVVLNGNLALGAGNTYSVRAAPNAADRLVVTGGANLAGAAFYLEAAPGAYTERYSQVVLRADGTFNQTRFASASTNLAYLSFDLVYSGDDRELLLNLGRTVIPEEGRAVRFADLVAGRNAQAVADAAETLGAGNAVYDAAINLPTGAPQGFFSALSGEAHAGVSAGLANLAGTVSAVPLDHLRGNLGAGMAAGAPTAAAGTSDAAPSAASLPSSLARPAWAQVVGNWQRIGATGDTQAMRQHTGGVFVGADHALGDGWRLGGALGYTDSKLTVDSLASRADVSSYSAIAYGGKAVALGAGTLKLMAGASYTWHDIGTERRVDAGGLNQQLDADYGASTTQLFGEAGYAFGAARGLTLEPYLGLGWAMQRTRGFAESGGSAALSGEAVHNNTRKATLGLRARQEVNWGGTAAALSAGLGWRHAFGDIRPESRLAFDAGESFTVTGAPIARNAALVELGVEAQVSRGASLGLSYAGQFGGGNRDQTASATVRWRF